MELCVSPSPGSNPCRTALLLQLGGAACTQCTECGLLLHCAAWPRVSVCWTQPRSDRPKCRLFAVWTQKGPRSRALGGARISPQRKGQFWEISLGPLQNMPDYPACGRYSQPNRSRVDGISAEPPQNRLYTQQ